MIPMTTTAPLPSTAIGPDDFRNDPHAARYVGTVDAEPEAFARLFAILNRPEADQRLNEWSASEPALAAVVRLIEAEPMIVAAMDDRESGNRFRQTVGVAIRLKMERLGWTTTGRKGSMGRFSSRFKRAERYERAASQSGDYRRRALAAMERIASIGTDEERRETGEELMAGLRAERAREGRPF